MGLKDRITPAMALLFLAPAIGELVSGSSPPLEFFNPLVLFLLCLMYGCGAILVREAVLRWKKGWLSLVLLGAAYGIAEEGLACKSFFDPRWVDIGYLGVYGRSWDVNWIWTLELTAYHAVVSITVSILVATALFWDRREEPWVSRKGLLLAGAGFAFIIPFCYFLLTPYRPPAPQLLAAAGVAATLAVLAWRVPHPFPWERLGLAFRLEAPAGRMRIRHFMMFGALWTGGLFFCSWILVWLLPWAAVTGAVMLLFFLASGLLLARDAGWGRGWTPMHQLGLAIGVLVPLLVLAPVMEFGSGRWPNGMTGMTLSALSFLLFFRWLFRRTAARVGKERMGEERGGTALADAAPA